MSQIQYTEEEKKTYIQKLHNRYWETHVSRSVLDRTDIGQRFIPPETIHSDKLIHERACGGPIDPSRY